jgi:hypothetical protein
MDPKFVNGIKKFVWIKILYIFVKTTMANFGIFN